MSENLSVKVEYKGALAFVSLNRPEKHNGLNRDMFEALVSTAKSIRTNRSIRAVILSGAGPSFSAGLDFAYLTKNPSMIPRFFLKLPWRKENMFQRAALVWQQLPIPVIAAIHGNCFGGAMQIALACDYRISTPDAKFSIMEMKWGLIPDMSGMVHLSRLTSLDIAQELTMTGRVFSADEGKEYNLVSKISNDPVATATELAGLIAQQSPDAVAAAKYLFKKTWKKGERSALLWERLVQLRLLGRKNQMIALKNGTKSDGEKREFLTRTSFK
ncbi:crotonase/enoyl-CoA hydratase family protein [Reinekea sp.]|uniref:crotonase/enoyl-CoA hydratase family protein n=1 Tax=Reinekea sp. TaxID=1970455 RepID=UPI0039892650